MKTKRNDDWMEQAERLGQQLAEGLERFGDRVAKAIETIESKIGPQIKKAGQGLGLEDERVPPGHRVGVEQVGAGDVFEQDRELYMRLGNMPQPPEAGRVDAVHLGSGNVRRFEAGTLVVTVDATLVVKGNDEPQSP